MIPLSLCIIRSSKKKHNKKIIKAMVNNDVVLRGKDKFRVKSHIQIIDKFVSEFNKIIFEYDYMNTLTTILCLYQNI